jgi:tetratricopeptide (TPR) repeat protein
VRPLPPAAPLRGLLLLAALPFTAAAAPELPAVRTVWERIMQEQGAVNLRKGYAHMGAENYQAAADEFFKAVQKTPGEAAPRLFYGSALYWLGAPDRALEEFEAALKLEPQNSMAFQLRGIVKARRGEYRAALEDFLQSELYAPERPDVKMNAGSVYHALGNYPRALEYFRAAVQRDPENPLYRHQLGMFYSRLGRYDQAAEELGRAVRLHPAYEDAVFELAVLRERTGRPAEAIKLYRRALELKPGDSAARYRICWALFKAGRYSELRKALPKAFQIAPANDKGGISMSLAYAGGSAPAPADGQQNRGPLYSALSRVPPEQEARVEVELLELPRAPQLQKTAAEGGRGGQLAAALSRPRVNYTKREYFLPASTPQERLRRAAEIDAEAAALLKAAGAGADARLSFNIDTARPAGPGKESGPRALYRPRDVGNDMGLWVMGDNWLENVQEALEEKEAWKEKDRPEFRLLRGLGRLLSGEPGAALEDFELPGAPAALGRSAAWTAAGDQGKALAACLEALRLEPSNAVARANRGWLEAAK